MRNYPKYDGELPQQVVGAMLHEVTQGNGGIAQYDGKEYQLTLFDEEMKNEGWVGSIIAPAGAVLTPISTKDVPMPVAPSGNPGYMKWKR